LAYVSGRGADGVMGLFDLSSRPAAHLLDDAFPGLDERSELAWCSGPEQFLLKTREDLKLVDTRLGGEAITLSTPSPVGFERFEVVALDTGRFMVLYPDGIEIWGSETISSRPIVPRVVFPVRYQVAEPVAGGRLVVVRSQAWAAVLNTITGGVEKLESRASLESGTFEVALNQSGARVASLQWESDTNQDELYVRRVDGRGELHSVRPITDDVVCGFAWGPKGESIAFFTESACYVDTFVGPPVEIQRFADATITDLQWVGTSTLVVTTRGLEAREASIVLEKQR
jgi:hypothetical protein